MLFSIVVPVYNVEKYLRGCLDSILAQTFADFELILVDDGSKDASPQICDEYSEKDSRIRAIHKPNEGANSARNRGIFAAAGEYVCLVDSDDTVERDWLEHVRQAIVSAPAAPDLVVYGYREDYPDRTIDMPLLIEPGYYDKPRLEREIFPRLINRDRTLCGRALIFEVPWNKVYKKELIRAHCCKNKEIKVSNDVAFAHECVLYAESLVACKDMPYRYAITTANSLQRSYHLDLLMNYRVLHLYMRERLEGLYPYIPEQLNALLAEHIKNGVCQELRFDKPLPEARRSLKRQFHESKILDMIKISSLPLKYRIRMILLKLHLYASCLILQKWMDRTKGAR